MAYEQGPIVVPVVNLNGTPAERLIEGYSDAREALHVAIRYMQVITPHGRDYQTEPRGVFGSAQTQHRSRIAKLEVMQEELLTIALAVQEQQRARSRTA